MHNPVIVWGRFTVSWTQLVGTFSASKG